MTWHPRKEAMCMGAFWSSGQHGPQSAYISTLMSVIHATISLSVSVLAQAAITKYHRLSGL